MIAFERADESSAPQQFYIGQCAKYVCNINHAGMYRYQSNVYIICKSKSAFI